MMFRVSNKYAVNRQNDTYEISSSEILKNWDTTSYSEYLSISHFGDCFVSAYFDFDNIDTIDYAETKVREFFKEEFEVEDVRVKSLWRPALVEGKYSVHIFAPDEIFKFSEWCKYMELNREEFKSNYDIDVSVYKKDDQFFNINFKHTSDYKIVKGETSRRTFQPVKGELDETTIQDYLIYKGKGDVTSGLDCWDLSERVEEEEVIPEPVNEHSRNVSDETIKEILSALSSERAIIYEQWLEICSGLLHYYKEDYYLGCDMCEFFSKRIAVKMDKQNYKIYYGLWKGKSDVKKQITIGTVFKRLEEDNPTKYKQIVKKLKASNASCFSTDYYEVKAKFEETYCYINNNKVIVEKQWSPMDKVYKYNYYTQSDIKVHTAPWQYKTIDINGEVISKPFFTNWWLDPEKKTYIDMDFVPNMKVSD